MENEVGLGACQVSVSIDVQWRDLDVLAHVNNAEYIKWFESARIAALKRVDLLTVDGRLDSDVSVGPILGSVSCTFLKPVGFPATVRVGTYLSRLGNSSFNLGYVVVQTETDEVVAVGDSVVVQFNYETQRSAPLTETMKMKLEERLAPND